MLDRENLWSKSKNLISKKADDPERCNHSQFDLTNFEEPVLKSGEDELVIKFKKKREQKAAQKLKQRAGRQQQWPLTKRPHPMNMNGKHVKMRATLYFPEEFYVKSDPASTKIKKGKLKKLNDYVNPILADQDPDNCIEDEYKVKHKQLFCWRFLRTVSYIDQSMYGPVKKDTKVKTFNGDVEQLAHLILDNAKKRDVMQQVNEELKEVPVDATEL